MPKHSAKLNLKQKSIHVKCFKTSQTTDNFTQSLFGGNFISDESKSFGREGHQNHSHHLHVHKSDIHTMNKDTDFKSYIPQVNQNTTSKIKMSFGRQSSYLTMNSVVIFQ